MLGIVKHLHLGPLQGVGELYVGLLAATILFIATNAGIIGVSRLVYSMGIHRQVPDRLRQLHPRFRTPWLGILVFSALACVAMIPGKADFLGNMYAFGAMLSFTIAHVAVVRLRDQAPRAGAARTAAPARCAGAGSELPLFALVGGVGTGLAWVTVTALHVDVALAGHRLARCSASALYAVYRRRQGLDLTTTTRVAVPKPVVDHEAEYESVLVAFEEREFEPEVLATATRHGRAPQPRHPRARDDHRSRRRARSTPRCPSRSWPRRRSSSRRRCRAAGA